MKLNSKKLSGVFALLALTLVTGPMAHAGTSLNDLKYQVIRSFEQRRLGPNQKDGLLNDLNKVGDLQSQAEKSKNAADKKKLSQRANDLLNKAEAKFNKEKKSKKKY